MESYDVIIVGAGIAGTGLAYNLKRFGYKGKILVLDGRNPGNNSGAGHRNTFMDIVDDYELPYLKKLKGFKIGFERDVLMTIDFDLYSVDYSDVCSYLLKKSGVEFRQERAFDVKDSFLFTRKNNYKFKYLIDCSGPNLFLRKIFKLPMPFRFWIANARFLDIKMDLDPNYAYYAWGDDYNLEELCLTDEGVYQLDWCYTKEVNFDLIDPSPRNFFSSMDQSKIVRKSRPVTIVSLMLPLAYKDKFAFLGDSFGNTSPLSVFGLECALRSSEILADSIIKGDLKSYERKWKKKYMDVYIKRLAIKIDLHHNTGLIKKLKGYPPKKDTLHVLKNHKEIFGDLIRKQFEVPKASSKELKSIYPKTRILWLGGHYLSLKIKYLIDNLKYGTL